MGSAPCLHRQMAGRGRSTPGECYGTGRANGIGSMSRMRTNAFPQVLASLALGGLVAWLVAYRPFSGGPAEEPSFLRLMAAASGEGELNLAVDEGHTYAMDRPPAGTARVHAS